MSSGRWIGIDQGYSQMGLAVLAPDGQVLASERTSRPAGDGHDREVALTRLRRLLARVAHLGTEPVRLAGYCYQHSGVAEAFAAAGWTVAGTKALNDVVGVYGLTAMRGHVLVAGCGTYGQLVYIDHLQAVRWPGEDVRPRLPDWLLSGEAFARFVARDPAIPAAVFAQVGPRLSESLEDPPAQAFLSRAADAVVETRDVFARHAGAAGSPPEVVLGGGAVRDDRLWQRLSAGLAARGVAAHRAAGDPAVGLARYAAAFPVADPWAFVGRERPAWLS